MAVATPILLGSESYGSEAAGQNTSAELVITLSRPIAANTLALCHVNVMEYGSDVDQPSVSGGGVTWELLQTNAYRPSGTRRATQFLFAAYGAAPSGVTITVTPGAPYRVVLAHVVEVPGANPDPVQNVIGSPYSSSFIGAQLVTLSDTTNNAVIAFGAYVRSADANRTWTPDANYGLTELDEARRTDADTQVASIHAQYIVGLAAIDPEITATLSGGSDAIGMIALELTESGATGATTLEADQFTAGASFTDATFERVTQADPMAVMASFSDVTFSIDPGGFTLDADPMSVSASFTDAALNYDGVGLARTLTADPFAVAALFADAALRQVVTNSAQATRASVSISIGL